MELERFVESPEGQELGALCLDYGYRLADSPADLTRPQIDFLMAALVSRMEKIVLARSQEAGVTKLVFADDLDDEESTG
ncbi:MAG TPA: hypothetical protein HA257_07345 [Candidatus Methanoperedenaceae archaeon]|nr:hypothetical protein [Candidatus Methanoperedenaceae archaeon]